MPDGITPLDLARHAWAQAPDRVVTLTIISAHSVQLAGRQWWDDRGHLRPGDVARIEASDDEPPVWSLTISRAHPDGLSWRFERRDIGATTDPDEMRGLVEEWVTRMP